MLFTGCEVRMRKTVPEVLTKRRIISVKMYVHAFFMNMVADKLWNKNFYDWHFGFDFDKISCSCQR